MIVCLCKGVSGHTVNRVIREGAQTVDDVARACGAGSDCGGCREHIQEMLADHEETALVRVSLRPHDGCCRRAHAAEPAPAQG